MNIFIVGSKPDAVIPNVVPDRIYACNGAIALLEKPKETTEMVGVVSRTVIYSEDPQDIVTRRQWAGRKLDRLIVAGGKPKSAKDFEVLAADMRALGLEFSHFSYIGNRFRKPALKLRHKKRLVCEVLWRLRKAEPGKFIHECKKTRILPELNISGGVRTLVIAKEEAPADSRFYLVGVGARKSKGHFYDQDAVFFKHASQDRNFLVDFSRRYPGIFTATDPVLARYLRRYSS